MRPPVRDIERICGRRAGIPSGAALRSVGDSPVQFHALSLAADSTPIPVVHSDEGFELLFGRPSPEALRQAMTALLRPFPAGLLDRCRRGGRQSGVCGVRRSKIRLTRNAYHGTVIWSWQQAVLAAGLQRQLAASQICRPRVKQLLRRAQAQLCGRHPFGAHLAKFGALVLDLRGRTLPHCAFWQPMPRMPTSPMPHNYGARSIWRYLSPACDRKSFPWQSLQSPLLTAK